MKALAEIIFVGEIVKQAKVAKRAAERLQATTDHFDELEVWCSIQSILVAAGNVSKILWPSQKYTARGEKYGRYSTLMKATCFLIASSEIISSITTSELKIGSRRIHRRYIWT